MDLLTTSSCLLPDIWFSTTPLMLTCVSRCMQPNTNAAAVLVILVQSMTRITGDFQSFATSAVLYDPSSSTPSYSPLLPSITATSPSRCETNDSNAFSLA